MFILGGSASVMGAHVSGGQIKMIFNCGLSEVFISYKSCNQLIPTYVRMHLCNKQRVCDHFAVSRVFFKDVLELIEHDRK